MVSDAFAQLDCITVYLDLLRKQPCTFAKYLRRARENMTFSPIKTLVLLVSFFWILGITGPNSTWWGRVDSVEALKLTELAIKKYKQTFGELPENLSELRVYLGSLGISYKPYDYFGQRIQYEKLSDTEYYLKSFSPNLDNPESQDITKYSTSGIEYKPIKLKQADLNKLSIYPAPALLGLKAPKGSLWGRINVDHNLLTRTLVVVNGNKKNFIRTAFHDRVEEFMWLPNGREIVFTASGSERYEDGIYVWDIPENTVINILETTEANLLLEQKTKYYFSLSSVDIKGVIYAYLAPSRGPKLDPRDFYSFSSLISISRAGSKWKLEKKKQGPSLFEFKASHVSQLNIPMKGGNSAQQIWLTLQTDGGHMENIHQWQNYCHDNSKSVIYHYCLWWLASLYNDYYRESLANNSSDANTIRSYGLEIAGFLDNDERAPEHLRAMAYFLKLELEKGNPANYKVSN